MQKIDYKFDVFLSWTGKDRELKNALKAHLEGQGLSCYDSDVECKGDFRKDYIMALQSSRVYVILMTDNLRNDPNISGVGTFTEVRKEISVALDMDAHGEINFIPVVFSDFFCFKDVYRDYNDEVGMFFYVSSRGYSYISALEGLTEEVCQKVSKQAKEYVAARAEGRPALSNKIRLGVVFEPIADCENFLGRKKELEEIEQAFYAGKRAVVLSGMGGMGKTSIARHFAGRCKEMGVLKCPQVVRVQSVDIQQNGDIFGAVCSAVNFDTDAIPFGLNETEKRKKQEQILSDLPEFVVLIIDNFSSLSAEEINLFLRRLQCRLLFTTRGKVEGVDQSIVAPVDVKSLEFDDAKTLFENISGQKVDEEDFKSLHDTVAGHTITMCLIAKAMKAHKKTVKDLLEELNVNGYLSENVVYIDGTDKRTNAAISAHLEALFSLGGFENDENCIKILRNMALLSDGTIKATTLCELLNLTNRNEINKLIEYGWLLDEDDSLFLHPILSQIANHRLCPTEETAAPVLQYLCDIVKNRDDFTYYNAGLVCDALYFALLRLAKNTGRLCKTLWNQYFELCRVIGDIDGMRKNCQDLSTFLNAPEEQKAVNMFCDMATLERRPTQAELIAPYLASLQSSADDYAFVLKALSLMGGYGINDTAHMLYIQNILRQALNAAMQKEDDFGVVNIIINLILLKPSKADIKNIERYIKQRKRKGNNGSIMMAELYISLYKAFGDNLVSSAMSMVRNDGGVNMFAHPVLLAKLFGLIKSIKKLSPDDEFYDFFNILLSSAESLENHGDVDVVAFFHAISGLLETLRERDMSAKSAFAVVQQLVTFVKALPAEAQGDLKQIAVAPVFDVKAFTVRDLSELKTSLEINSALMDRHAVFQAMQLVEAEASIHPADHIDVTEACLKLASTYALFGHHKEALSVYISVLRTLQRTAPASQKLYEVALAILSVAGRTQSLSVQALQNILNTGRECCEKYSSAELLLVRTFIVSASYTVRNKETAQILLHEIKNITQNYGKFIVDNPSQSFLWTLNDEVSCFAHIFVLGERDYALEISKEIVAQEKYAVGKKEKVKFQICKKYMALRFLSYENEQAAQLENEIIRLGAKHRTNFMYLVKYAFHRKIIGISVQSTLSEEKVLSMLFGKKAPQSAKDFLKYAISAIEINDFSMKINALKKGPLPCECGSGKKYKDCCLPRDLEIVQSDGAKLKCLFMFLCDEVGKNVILSMSEWKKSLSLNKFTEKVWEGFFYQFKAKFSEDKKMVMNVSMK